MLITQELIDELSKNSKRLDPTWYKETIARIFPTGEITLETIKRARATGEIPYEMIHSFPQRSKLMSLDLRAEREVKRIQATIKRKYKTLRKLDKQYLQELDKQYLQEIENETNQIYDQLTKEVYHVMINFFTYLLS